MIQLFDFRYLSLIGYKFELGLPRFSPSMPIVNFVFFDKQNCIYFGTFDNC